MSLKNKKKTADFIPNETTTETLRSIVDSDSIDCASAFNLSRKLSLPTSETGLYLDHCNIRLKRCQIGLFGYGSGNKLIKKLSSLDPSLSDRITSLTENDRLSCASVFIIASEFRISKVDVGNACETLGIKINGCRFGAF